ncbi:MAG: type II toxin-antitoxin system VapC family toxin [Alphaproteobacteria bacterium]|uniref:Type II toxin-antitoxin system VapC family toxin n=1 Tax=Candidatus Nitrobium versatile TaxID=2884831 RepID=A0A953M3E5_9BACT|nr:type II toxin-antitoxin system VapC family toxin [Candidatus Nitrobium versatile]
MIVLDTHVLLWWLSNPENLSSKAAEIIEKSMKDRAIYVSSISAWEIAMLSSRGRLELTIDVDDWIAAAESLPFVYFVPVNNRIAIKSVHLPDFAHPDPADRIIIATALSLRATLVTKDRRILDYPHVTASW